MKLQLLVAVPLALWSVSIAHSQASKTEPQVTAHIAQQRYCSARQHGVLLTTFGLNVHNRTDSAVQLSLPLYLVARVSRHLGDLQRQKYEAILGVPLLEIHKGSSPPPSSQVTVNAGETQDVPTMEITFPLSNSSATSRQGEMGTGTHFVELDFSVRDTGSGAFVKLHSQPVKLTIQPVEKPEPCK